MQSSETPPRENLLETLSNIAIQINALQAIAQSEEGEIITSMQRVRQGLTTLEQMAREALYTARSASEDLLPDELVDMTLSEALTRLVEGMAESLGLSSRLSFSGIDDQGYPEQHTLSAGQQRVLYFIAQEALYQVREYASVKRLRLSLSYGADDVQMTIEDDGQYNAPDIDDPAVSTEPNARPFLTQYPETDRRKRELLTRSGGNTLGGAAETPGIPPDLQWDAPILGDLRYRVKQLGGTLEIVSLEDRGRRIQVRIPYMPHTHDAPATTTESNEDLFEDALALPPGSATVERIRILIVDGQAVTRAGLHRLLEIYPDIQIVGEAADGVQAVSETLELGPRIVLMDAHLPGDQSLEALRQIRQLNLDTRVLLLSAQDHEEYLYQTLRAGADGYVLKDIAPEELAQAIRVVARGEALIQPQIAGRLLASLGKQGNKVGRRDLLDTLTAREVEVLGLLAKGMRNKEIAARLFVSERTVNFHLANIYQKLNVSGRTEALSKAIEQGLLKV
jgi:DNA-binding NarL/FixJ family response regulator